MTVELSQYNTVRDALAPVRRQAEEIIACIVREAREAARLLGFTAKSHTRLMIALDAETGAWERAHGESFSYLCEHHKTMPPSADRAVCVVMVSMLLDVREDIGPNLVEHEGTGALVDFDFACEQIQGYLTTLRTRLPRVIVA